MIESVDPSRVDLLAELHAQAFDQPWTAGELAVLLENPTAFALLATQGAPAGFVLAWAVAGEAEILTLAVDPRKRRKGVGTALVAAAAGVAAARGAESIHLEVNEHNAAARAMYEKLGFGEIGRRRGYYGDDGATALLMRRDLPM